MFVQLIQHVSFVVFNRNRLFFYCRCTEARCCYLSVDSSLAYQDSHVLDVLKDLTHCLSRQRVPADL